MSEDLAEIAVFLVEEGFDGSCVDDFAEVAAGELCGDGFAGACMGGDEDIVSFAEVVDGPFLEVAQLFGGEG